MVRALVMTVFGKKSFMLNGRWLSLWNEEDTVSCVKDSVSGKQIRSPNWWLPSLVVKPAGGAQVLSREMILDIDRGSRMITFTRIRTNIPARRTSNKPKLLPSSRKMVHAKVHAEKNPRDTWYSAVQSFSLVKTKKPAYQEDED
jgi:hypothetical protein